MNKFTQNWISLNTQQRHVSYANRTYIEKCCISWPIRVCWSRITNTKNSEIPNLVWHSYMFTSVVFVVIVLSWSKQPTNQTTTLPRPYIVTLHNTLIESMSTNLYAFYRFAIYLFDYMLSLALVSSVLLFHFVQIHFVKFGAVRFSFVLFCTVLYCIQ